MPNHVVLERADIEKIEGGVKRLMQAKRKGGQRKMEEVTEILDDLGVSYDMDKGTLKLEFLNCVRRVGAHKDYDPKTIGVIIKFINGAVEKALTHARRT